VNQVVGYLAFEQFRIGFFYDKFTHAPVSVMLLSVSVKT
jgi:hypothetical protein